MTKKKKAKKTKHEPHYKPVMNAVAATGRIRPITKQAVINQLAYSPYTVTAGVLLHINEMFTKQNLHLLLCHKVSFLTGSHCQGECQDTKQTWLYLQTDKIKKNI